LNGELRLRARVCVVELPRAVQIYQRQIGVATFEPDPGLTLLILCGFSEQFDRAPGLEPKCVSAGPPPFRDP
jgi:hypothetical protein